MKGWYDALEHLSWLTQLGLSMLLPLVVFLWCSWYVCENWHAPYWVYLVAIALGLGSGVQTFRHFSRRLVRKAEKERPQTIGFNRHV